jgi:hypothetical protein
MKVLNGERPERPVGPPAMSDKLWQDVREFWADDAAARPLAELVVQKMLWPSAEPQASRPLPLLPPSRSSTPPTGLTPYTFSFPESSPSANNSPSAEVFEDVIPPDDDLRRLSNECKTGVGSAMVLGDALSMAAPEQLNDPVIVVCSMSTHLIATKLLSPLRRNSTRSVSIRKRLFPHRFSGLPPPQSAATSQKMTLGERTVILS